MNLFFECNSGAAGDMLASALFDLFEDKQDLLSQLNALSLPETKIIYEQKETHGISGAHLEVIINGETEMPDSAHAAEHSHRHLSDIIAIVDSLQVSDKVKSDVKNIYTLIAEAEAKAHNTEAGEVHFHELGMLDAVADITVCAYLIEKLAAARILCSPVNVGGGTVKCAHGVLPVPAPATAEILVGMPYYKSEIETELCTPTGAAVLKYFADEFTSAPEFNAVRKIGTGCGTKEYGQANIVRVFELDGEFITELSCNVDDMTGEEISFATEKLISEGALDCFVAPVFMKKGRPAYLLTLLCRSSDSKKFAELIFKHTTSLGIRKYTPSRYTLERTFTEEGGVTLKRSEGFGVTKEKPEFEDIKKLALEEDISVFEAREKIKNKR